VTTSRTDVVIREATTQDLEAIVDLLALASLAPGADDSADLAPYRPALAEIDATPGTYVLVAELEGVVVGVCQLITFCHLQARGGPLRRDRIDARAPGPPVRRGRWRPPRSRSRPRRCRWVLPRAADQQQRSP
jgi:hypothetical protein